MTSIPFGRRALATVFWVKHRHFIRQHLYLAKEKNP